MFDTEAGVWVSKQDVGTNGLTEKEKSQASDSFKRACFNWGIGRELYSAPFIWIPAGKVNIQSKEGGSKEGSKYVCYDRFSVASIAYNDSREITELHIVNERGLEVYCWERKPIQEQTKQLPEAGHPTGQKPYQQQEDRSILSVEQLSSLQAELARTGVKMQDVRERYQVGRPEEMSPELYGKVMKALARTKSAHAA